MTFLQQLQLDSSHLHMTMLKGTVVAIDAACPTWLLGSQHYDFQNAAFLLLSGCLVAGLHHGTSDNGVGPDMADV